MDVSFKKLLVKILGTVRKFKICSIFDSKLQQKHSNDVRRAGEDLSKLDSFELGKIKYRHLELKVLLWAIHVYLLFVSFWLVPVSLFLKYRSGRCNELKWSSDN